jgi:hypothetical protein
MQLTDRLGQAGSQAANLGAADNRGAADLASLEAAASASCQAMQGAF